VVSLLHFRAPPNGGGKKKKSIETGMWQILNSGEGGKADSDGDDFRFGVRPEGCRKVCV
jgi:hypothetical protein